MPLTLNDDGTLPTQRDASGRSQALAAVNLALDAMLDLFIGPVDPRTMGTTVTPATNANYLSAFQVMHDITVAHAVIRPGTQSGNVCVAILDADRNRLATTGAVACPAAAVSTLDFTASVDLVPGVKYYAAFACDNNTATFLGLNLGGASMGATLGLGGVVSPGTFPIPTSVGAPAAANQVFLVAFTE